MDAVKVFSALPAARTAKIFNSKAEAASPGKPMDFSKLLEAVFAEMPEMADSRQTELLDSLEQLATALEELPAETLSAEEQEVVYALVQLLASQTAQMEKRPGTGESVLQNLPLRDSSGEDKLAAIKTALENLKADHAVQEKPAATDIILEQPIMDDSEQQELLSLLRQLDDKLEKLADPAGQSKDTAEATAVVNDPKKFEQLFKQLAVLIRQLGTEQQATTQQVPAQLMETIEQIQKQLAGLAQQIEKPMPKADSFPGAAWQLSTSQPASANRIPLPQGDGMPQPEPLQQQESGQAPVAAAAPDTAKLSQTAERPVIPGPTATVRLSNLVEELGEVIRGSMRVTGTSEGTQLRVNIFPEHLGHLDIRLTAVDGKLAAQIFTSNLAAKDLLDLQVNQLRNALAQQGVTVDKIEITQQPSQQSSGQHAQPDQRFSQQQQKQEAPSRDRNAYQRIEEEVIAERSQPADGLMSVDYTV